MLTSVRRPANDNAEIVDRGQDQRNHNERSQDDELNEQAEINLSPERIERIECIQNTDLAERTVIVEIARRGASPANIAATEPTLTQAQEGTGGPDRVQDLDSETDANTSGRKRKRRRKWSRESRRFQKVIDGLNERISSLEKSYRESMGSKSTTIINRKCRYYQSAIERVKREHYMV